MDNITAPTLLLFKECICIMYVCAHKRSICDLRRIQSVRSLDSLVRRTISQSVVIRAGDRCTDFGRGCLFAPSFYWRLLAVIVAILIARSVNRQKHRDVEPRANVHSHGHHRWYLALPTERESVSLLSFERSFFFFFYYYSPLRQRCFIDSSISRISRCQLRTFFTD